MVTDSTTHDSRQAVFRTAITHFIATRREEKLKGAPDTQGKYDYAIWLADAARRSSQIQAVTHVLKASHADARGSSLHVQPRDLPQHAEIGSHLLGEDFAEDVVGNAAALDVYKFLKVEVDGQRLLDWIMAGDGDLAAALSRNTDEARAWMQAFAKLVRNDTQPSTHPLAKQLYWLVGEEPQQDEQYQLLQPLFASSLAHVVHADIQVARFGDDNKLARQRWRERKPHEQPYRDYPGLAVRKLGGTKPQNISQLNSERGGINYLLPSLPPRWSPRKRIRVLKRDSVFDDFLWFGNVRHLLGMLVRFLRSNPARILPTRQHREAIEQAIGQELALFGVTIRAAQPAGWSRTNDCRLPACERLWLDPDRTELQDRIDAAHPEWTEEDATFKRDYHWGSWADQVAERFGNWLNHQLRQAKLVTMAEKERSHWARQAILDVAWPIPLQRRTQGDRT